MEQQKKNILYGSEVWAMITNMTPEIKILRKSEEPSLKMEHRQ